MFFFRVLKIVGRKFIFEDEVDRGSKVEFWGNQIEWQL